MGGHAASLSEVGHHDNLPTQMEGVSSPVQPRRPMRSVYFVSAVGRSLNAVEHGKRKPVNDNVRLVQVCKEPKEHVAGFHAQRRVQCLFLAV
jgi:hypothetical protein